MTEREVHIAILQYLRLVMGKDGVVLHPANEMDLSGDRKAIARAQGKAKTLGMYPGAADLLCCYRGRFWAFEVKKEGGRLTDNQRAFGEAVTRAGGRWAVVRSIDDVEECLNEWRGDVADVELRGIVT